MSSSIHVLNTSLGGGLRPPSEPPPGIAPAKPALEAEHLSRGARIIRFVRRQPTLVVGVVVLAIIALGGAFAPVWWTGDPLEMRPIERLTSPVAGHWFGTDNFGRDVYTRTIYGTRARRPHAANLDVLHPARAGCAAHRAGDLHLRLGHPVRGVPVVPRCRHAAPHPVVGQHHGRGQDVRAARVLDHPVPRPLPRADRPRHQPRRRRAARDARRALTRRGTSPPILVGGGLDGPLRNLPQNGIARAKPALAVARMARKPALEPVGSSVAYGIRQQHAECARAARLRTLSACSKRALRRGCPRASIGWRGPISPRRRRSRSVWPPRPSWPCSRWAPARGRRDCCRPRRRCRFSCSRSPRACSPIAPRAAGSWRGPRRCARPRSPASWRSRTSTYLRCPRSRG